MGQCGALILQTLLLIHLILIDFHWGAAQDGTQKRDEWVKQVAPGIRLIGQAEFSSLRLPNSHVRAWSPDGKHLLGAVGRKLVEIDWEQKAVTREVTLPMNPATDLLRSLLYSPDGENGLVMIQHGQRGNLEKIDDYWSEDDDSSIDEEREEWSGQRLLVYDSDWNLKHDWNLSDRVSDLAYHADCRLTLSDQRTVLIHSDKSIIAFDFLSGQIQASQTGWNAWAFPLSATELLLAQSQEVWDLRQQTTYPADKIGLPQKCEIRAVDRSGNFIALIDPVNRRVIAWNRQTRQTQTLLENVEFAGCLFSSDGQLCFINVAEFYGDQKDRYRSKIAIYDLRKKELVGQSEFTNGPKRLSIRPGHESLIVDSFNDSTFVEVSVDDDFVASLSRALNHLPTRGRLSFADNDRVLVLHGNNSFLQNNEAAQVTQHFSYDPDYCVYSPTKPQRLRRDSPAWNDHVVETGHWSEDKFKRLYTIKPSTALSTLKSLLGVPGDSAPSIQSVQLSFDPSGDLIRDLYIENGEIMRLRTCRAASGRQVSEVRLDVEFDPSLVTRGAVAPNGARVSVVNNRQLTVLDAESGQSLGQWPVGPHVAAVQLDDRGQYVLVASGKPDRNWVHQIVFDQLHVYRVSNGEVVWSETNREIKGFGFQSGKDRLYVLTSGQENTLRFFDRDTWQETWRHATSHGLAYGIAISSSGHEVALGLRDSRVEFWRLSELQGPAP
jgi:hypothetical protein